MANQQLYRFLMVAKRRGHGDRGHGNRRGFTLVRRSESENARAEMTRLSPSHSVPVSALHVRDSAGAAEYDELMELIFEIRDAEEGGFYARALGHAIFTEGETWDELRRNVLEAVGLHFEDDSARPRLVQLHYTRDELIPLAAA